MKIHTINNNNKPTGELTFTSNGKKGHIILISVEKVIINLKTNELKISDFELPMPVKVDDGIYLNINWIFIEEYELNIDYDTDNVILSVNLKRG